MNSKFDTFNTPQHKGKKCISPTMAACVLQCPWQYWARYVGKVDKESGLAMERGQLFDRLIKSGNRLVELTYDFGIYLWRHRKQTLPDISEAEWGIIVNRYEDYRLRIPPGVFEHPIMIDLEHEG